MSPQKESIAKGSKSFFLASLFFPRELREACWGLYRWCRVCDDRIDDSAPGLATSALAEIRRKTRGDEIGEEPCAYRAFRELCERYQVPRELPFEMIKGFEMDVEGTCYDRIEDVRLYSYRVAGVVGLMMCHLMGVKNQAAWPHAVDLGIAMQYTNIARDVREDALRGRVYLPSDWLAEEGIQAVQILGASEEAKVHAVVLKLLREADRFYESGLRGLRYLPWRAAWAVGIAALIYRAIGLRIRRKGPSSIRERTIVPLTEKLYWTTAASLRLLPLALVPRKQYAH